jgi:hypothetical protein
MTEAQWLAATDPKGMLTYLRFRCGARKLRLFAAACARSRWDHLEMRFRKDIEEAERLARDRELIASRGLRAAHNDARPALAAAFAATGAEPEREVGLLRDIFGTLPFRPVAVERGWLTWADGAILGLARAAYEERMLPASTLEPARLAILADALEDAGCTDADILRHCRGPGPHVRGCWVVDLILGKS